MNFKPGLSKKIAISALLALAVSGSLWAASAFAAKGGPTIVLFNANWAASGREVVPIIKEIAGQNNLTVIEIDVDEQNAPQQAKDFGLSIPAGDPPHVYYVNKGQTILLFDGRGYKYGHSDSVRATVLEKLQPMIK